VCRIVVTVSKLTRAVLSQAFLVDVSGVGFISGDFLVSWHPSSNLTCSVRFHARSSDVQQDEASSVDSSTAAHE
jgi:hypothetical protein